MRTTSEFWASGLIRRGFAEGAFAAIAKRGAKEAGAIFVVVNRLDGTFDLYAPAPQSFFDEEAFGERQFEHRLKAVPEAETTALLAREKNMDPDFWVIEIEDREGRGFVEVVE